MIYAHAHDQTVTEDYFAALERVKKRLEIVPEGQKDEKNEREGADANTSLQPKHNFELVTWHTNINFRTAIIPQTNM